MPISGLQSQVCNPPSAIENRQSGFTLLEVILALFVLATAVVLVGEGVTQTVRSINVSREDTTRMLLAQGKMSEIVAGLMSADIDKEGDFEAEGHPEYSYTIETAATETAGLQEIVVTVKRNDEENPRAFTLRRLLYQPEPLLEEFP